MDQNERQSRINEPELHVGPEYAVAERDVSELVTGEIVTGSSLWRDAWRRLLRNKLAVFGMVVVVLIALSAIAGPAIIKATTGFTYDSIPKDTSLLKSIPPFRGPNGEFSWKHPMGTDIAGRDVLARVCSCWRIAVLVSLFSTLLSLCIGVWYGSVACCLCCCFDDLI